MPTSFKRYRVTYVPAPRTVTCWRQTRDEAEEYAKGMLGAQGIEWSELWAVEEPEAWAKLFGQGEEVET